MKTNELIFASEQSDRMYNTPVIEVVEVIVERGFLMTGIGPVSPGGNPGVGGPGLPGPTW
jgi:hypothetical protein